MDYLQMTAPCENVTCDHLHPHADKADTLRDNTKVFNMCLINKMGLEQWSR